MPDPILDEDILLRILKETQVSRETCADLQSAAFHAAIAAHDRGTKREQFIGAMQSIISHHAQLSKLFMLGTMREHLVEGTLNLELIDHTINKMTVYATQDQASVVQFMDLLVQCPTSQDNVH